MSQFDKLIKRICSLPKDVRFEELKKILVHYGYSMMETRGGSSHVSFRKNGEELIITIPRHEPVNTTYVKLVRDIILRESEGA